MSAPASGADTESGTGLSAEITLALQRAAWIGRDEKGPRASYSGLFTALLVSQERELAWLRQAARTIGPKLPDVVGHWKTNFRANGVGLEERIVELKTSPTTVAPLPIALTPSAKAVIDLARGLARNGDGSGLVAARHLLGAYVYLSPSEHDGDLTAWKFNRPAWSVRLLQHVARSHAAELPAWSSQHAEKFAIRESAGLQEVRRLASQLAMSEIPPEICADVLLNAILLDGANHPDGDYASTRLFKMLGVPSKPIAERPHIQQQQGSAPPLAKDLEPTFRLATSLAAASGQEQVHVRHVAGALLAAGPWTGKEAVWTAAKRTRHEAAAALRGWVRDHGAAEANHWDTLLDANDDVRAAGYRRDAAEGEDCLDFERDVRALAAVLAHKETRAPVSVGMFGDWGSGKSFFMRLLRDRIKSLASRSGKGASTQYCGDVIQIEFNAWQFMDADLWACLASHIFDSLETALDDEKKKSLVDYASELTAVEAEREAVKRAEATTKAQIVDVNAKIATLEKERAKAAPKPDTLLKTIGAAVAKDPAIQSSLQNAANRLGIKKLATSIDEARAERAALSTTLGRLHAHWQRLAWWQRVIALVVLLLPAIAAVISQFADVASPAVVAFVGGVVSLLTTVKHVASSFHSAILPAVHELDSALTRAEEIDRAERQTLTAEEERLAAEVARLETERRTFEEKLAKLELKKAEIEAALSTGRNLKRFVIDRATSDAYRKNLGIISIVHDDFTKLADFLANPDTEPRVDRIILYIDDLDRCPPKRVVEVLQAIHLVLSLPLFVVVVAVDSGWLLQSLEAYYAENFPSRAGDAAAGEWENRPQHYLEKIFQIPMTVPPMTPGGFKTLIEAQVRPADPVTRKPVLEALVTPEPRALEALVGTPENKDAPPPPPPPPPPDPDPDPEELTPSALNLGVEEIAHLATLTPLIGSPRSAKRLVNLYRLVRAGLDGDELDQLLDGDYQVLQWWLAAVIGQPSRSAAVFSEVRAGRIDSGNQLASFVAGQVAIDPRWKPLETVVARTSDAEWASVTDTIRRVSRFSIETCSPRPVRKP